MIKFEIYLAKDNLHHWRLKASNGEIICWSEGYNTRYGAKQSVEWVKKYAHLAFITEIN